MAIKRRTKVEPSFSMASMTDVVFLLLIFFLVTSTLVNPNALKLLLPRSSNQVAAKPSLSISIKHYLPSNTFSYHINGQNTPVPLRDLERLTQEALVGAEHPIISLHADKTVPLEQVVYMMNLAKRNQCQLIIATAPE